MMLKRYVYIGAIVIVAVGLVYCFKRNWTNASNELVYREDGGGQSETEA